ncbi:DUF4843 domain-containing protein [Flavobacterium jejuense]|uniref:DUF4843 domain-containing protein n=1 Tax=Flavobacterium jejuense TaxID=1544455 RepID=A0ABX0IP72_9FLAO|nr:DUF4843 domain-containing protein [Flavobacterium jejuense]NHN25371.1 DUF4843 domain-containing protein [Flavobacterium jejuense]
MNYKKIIAIFSLIVPVLFLTGCSDEDENSGGSLNYVSFESKTYNVSIEENLTETYDVKVFTTNISGEDRTFSVEVDLGATTADTQYYSVPGTVTVPANTNVGVIPVNVTGTDLGNGKDIVLKLVPSTAIYTNSVAASNSKITIKITQACFLNPVVLSFTFDSYPEETSWELYQGVTLYASAAAGDYTGLATYSQNLCLPDGDYTFVVYDVYSDGINAPGGFTLTSGTTTLASDGGNFGGSTSFNFTF